MYIYIFFDFEVEVVSWAQHTARHDQQFAGPLG